MIPNKITKSKQLTICSKLHLQTDSEALDPFLVRLRSSQRPNKLYAFSIQYGSSGKYTSVELRVMVSLFISCLDSQSSFPFFD